MAPAGDTGGSILNGSAGMVSRIALESVCAGVWLCGGLVGIWASRSSIMTVAAKNGARMPKTAKKGLLKPWRERVGIEPTGAAKDVSQRF